MTAVPFGLVIFGFGGHARSVADIALTLGIKGLIFVDEAAKAGDNLWGFPVCKTFDDPLPNGWETLAASGDNQIGKAQIARLSVAASISAGAGSVVVDPRVESGTYGAPVRLIKTKAGRELR